MVDVVLAAVDTVAVVYVMRGAFKRHHLLAETRRHLVYVLRGRPHQPGLDEHIVQTVVDDYTRPVGRRMMTADLRALYPRDTEDQAVLRPLTRNRTAAPYEQARLAAGALWPPRSTQRGVRSALGSRPRPYAVAVPATSRPHPRPLRTGPKAGRPLEPETGIDAMDQTRQTLEAAAAEMAATLQNSRRAREAAHGLRRRRSRRRTPSSPAYSTRRAGVQEESREHPGRTAQRRSSPRPCPCCPRGDGRRA